MATVLLFDVDGTLVLTGGAGRRALARAFEEVCGVPDACSSIQFDGMTDRAIVRGGLRVAGHSDAEEEITRLLDLYVRYVNDEVRASPGYRIMPGVEHVLGAVGQWQHVAVGLGTGNVRGGAKAKLVRGGLWDHFSFGGFGCDHEERSELLRRGAARGAERLGRRFSECQTIIIGDTPRDVVAAHAIGAKCVGVGTAGYDEKALADAGADFVFPSLEDPRALNTLGELAS